MTTKSVAELLSEDVKLQDVTVKGWVRTFRANRFIALNDGSTINNIQCVVDFENFEEALLKRITTGAAIEVMGELVESQGKGQSVEIQVKSIVVHGDSDPEAYPIQPKKHTFEFLRENAHLRTRTNTFSAVMRLRSSLSFAIHKYFNDNGFYYMHTPIITGSDAEGAGEMFRVSTLDAKNPPLENSNVNIWGEKLYTIIEREIKIIEDEVGGNDIKSLNRLIKKHLENYTLKKIILANPSEIIRILESDKKGELKQLNYIFKLFYTKLKSTLFDIKIYPNGRKRAYLKKWLNDELIRDGVIKPNKDGSPFWLSHTFPLRKYGYLFSLSVYNIKKVAQYSKLSEESSLDFSEDFFGKETNLTVSGQLEAETYAMSLGKVYTFGPTFRAENSNTSRHLAEFWMIEPEVAFMDLAGNMDLAEDFMKSVLSYVLEHNREDLEFLDNRLQQEEKKLPQAQRSPMNLIDKIKFVVDNNFKRVSYTEAIEILRNSKPNKKKKFNYIIEEWGADLQSEHERFLVEKHFKCPVILFDYPANIKAFYMRLNEDGKTVRAMDILFPGIGEMVGGSQREERLDVLKEKMAALDIPEEELWWYLDLRKYGTAVHSGFGLGFERLVMFATGMGNIRDVIPYPRTPQNAEF